MLAPIPQNDQTQIKQFVRNSRRIFLSMFDYFIGLALKGLTCLLSIEDEKGFLLNIFLTKVIAPNFF